MVYKQVKKADKRNKEGDEESARKHYKGAAQALLDLKKEPEYEWDE